VQGFGMPALDPADVLIELWREAKLDDEALDEVALTGNRIRSPCPGLAALIALRHMEAE
jgi:hypothetical protein